MREFREKSNIGALAQLVERCNGIAEVVGSTPICSIKLAEGHILSNALRRDVDTLLKTNKTKSQLQHSFSSNRNDTHGNALKAHGDRLGGENRVGGQAIW